MTLPLPKPFRNRLQDDRRPQVAPTAAPVGPERFSAPLKVDGLAAAEVELGAVSACESSFLVGDLLSDAASGPGLSPTATTPLGVAVGWEGATRPSDQRSAALRLAVVKGEGKLPLLDRMADEALNGQVRSAVANAAWSVPGGEGVLAKLAQHEDATTLNGVLQAAHSMRITGRRFDLDGATVSRMMDTPGVDRALLVDAVEGRPEMAPVLRRVATESPWSASRPVAEGIAAMRALQGLPGAAGELSVLADQGRPELRAYAQRCLYDLNRHGARPVQFLRPSVAVGVSA